MRLQVIQHVPFEGPGAIADWAAERGHTLTVTRLDRGEPLPGVDAFDWLVVMGGPMSVHDEGTVAWMPGEKRLIRDAVGADKRVLGICLGAQMIADALGGAVTRAEHKEIGWFPVIISPEARPLGLFPAGSHELLAFHWHGETFDLPPDATLLAASSGCRHQAFAIGRRVVGLQFHFEVNEAGVAGLVEHCADEIGTGPYEQTPAALAGSPAHFATLKAALYHLLDRMAEKT